MAEIQDARAKLERAIITLLSKDRLMGEILITIPREIISGNDGGVDLAWKGDQLILTGQDQVINGMRMDDLVNNLQHQALHIIWQHPLRYADRSDKELVGIACDIAVNQYLDRAAAGTMTLEKIKQIIRQPLLAKQDSSYYLKKLSQLNPDQKKQLADATKRYQHGKKKRRVFHQGWFNHGNSLVRRGRLKATIKKSVDQLSERQRGQLPQPIKAALEPADGNYQLPFRHAFWRLIGQVPRGYQPSRARFNRRQPQRLELPGKITKLVSYLYVFIDESGSMSNATVAKIIQLLNQLTKRADIEMMVGSFDAAVQSSPERITGGRTLTFERHGGGGTSYQSVFNYLRDQHIRRQTPLVIVTDGWGESSINDWGFHQTLWLLTRQGDLSVKNIPTMVTRLEEQS